MAEFALQDPSADCAPALQAVVEDVMPEVPGAVRSVVEQAAFRAYRDFFYKTKVWIQKLGPYDLKANNPLVVLDQVDAYRLVGYPILVSMYDNDTGETTTNLQHVSSRDYIGRDPTTRGTPGYYICENPGELKIWPQTENDLENALIVYASTYPIEKEFELPLWLLHRYQEGYRAGALRNLLLQPSKPYTNTATARYYGQVYNKWIAVANADYQRNYTVRGLSWRFPRFGY